MDNLTLKELKEHCRGNKSLYSGFSYYKKTQLVEFIGKRDFINAFIDCDLEFIRNYHRTHPDCLSLIQFEKCFDIACMNNNCPLAIWMLANDNANRVISDYYMSTLIHKSELFSLVEWTLINKRYSADIIMFDFVEACIYFSDDVNMVKLLLTHVPNLHEYYGMLRRILTSCDDRMKPVILSFLPCPNIFEKCSIIFRDIEEECPVCYEHETIGDWVETDCGHVICKSCLQQTFEVSHCNNCPMCRHDIQSVCNIHVDD